MRNSTQEERWDRERDYRKHDSVPLIRFCHDCCKESTETSWSDYFRVRLCVDCYNIRCEPPAHDNSQRLAVASLIGECEAIAASGELSESHELSLRMLVANALTAFGMTSKRERETA